MEPKPPLKTYKPSYLKDWREFAGISVQEMAAAIGISVKRLDNIEQGRRPYTQRVMEAACDRLSLYFPALNVADLVATNPRSSPKRLSVYS